ncbi:hypothetical protein FRC11_014374 [Ceratobasidium sp. 423]|nr:hypothetical protein FRC11_014374 [Ceratobasidium sp. 423]
MSDLSLESTSLLICILTEGTSSEDGSLWVDEDIEGKNWHMPFKEFFHSCMGMLAPAVPALMRWFMHRTVIPIACGVGLREESMKHFQAWLAREEALDEVVMPLNMSIIASTMQGFLVKFITHLYECGFDIETTLLHAWLGDESAQHHTGLILM